MESARSGALLASRAVKKISKCDGVCALDTQEKWQWMQRRTAVNDVWGIGRRLSKRLADFGIQTTYDLAQANPKVLRRHINVNIERTIEELNGIPCLGLEEEPQPRSRSIAPAPFVKSSPTYSRYCRLPPCTQTGRRRSYGLRNRS
ncbi:hypothetical protein ACJJIG_17680 [Microbulbifer sp. SSSA007]|uniref:hypothetical protein n=1 Tax=Microbulbifer sp. SSSA007 TaxID=3243379 RepID=UPI0040393AA1